MAAMAAGDRHGSVQARELEEEKLARRTPAKHRTELECKSRRELQSLAKDVYGITANLKSSVIIDGILQLEFDYLPYHFTTYMKTMEAVRL